MQTSGNGMVRGAGADCRGACHATYNSGAAVHLEAVADAGSTFKGWSGACSGTAACDLTLGANAAVTANFAANAPKMHLLTVTVDNHGAVTSQPAGINCPGSVCAADFAEGSTVMLSASAVPASGWVFGGWSGACSGATDCSVKMDADATVRANFNPPPPPPPPAKSHVIVSVSGNGQVTGSGINCGFGATNCDVIVNEGTGMTLNAVAGGQARFMGWSAPCGATGACSFPARGEMRVTATFWDNLTTLVANDGTNMTALAINSKDVFYPRYTNADGGSIWAVSKDGGQPRRIASGYASGPGMAADDGYVYWTSYNAIYSAPVGGGAASQIYANSSGLGRLALDSDGALYFIAFYYDSTGYHGTVNRMQDRKTTVLVSTDRGAAGIAVDDKYVYFGSGSASDNGGLMRSPKMGGGTIEHLATCGPGTCQINGIKADGAYVVYVMGGNGETYSVPKGGGTPKLLSTGNVSQYYYDNDIDANDGVAYWTHSGSYDGRSENGIFSARVDGSSWSALDTGSDSNWHGPRVDGTAIYYWRAGSLMRRLK